MLLPARMVAEHVYCPRLAYMEWVERVWADSPDTAAGRMAHRGVDRPDALAPAPWQDAEAPNSVRSLELSDGDLGFVARMDLVEFSGERAVPVEYKVGRPTKEHGAWEADRVQVAIQALLLRAAGYTSNRAVVYYAGAKERVDVDISEDLVREALLARDAMRQAAGRDVAPPPLVDSPKCPRCSLVGICLPDEINLLRPAPAADEGPDVPGRTTDAGGDRVRRLIPARPDSVPLYLTTQGSTVRKNGDRLVVTRGGDDLLDVRLADVSSVSAFGNIAFTPQAHAALLAAGIPVAYFSASGWFRGATSAASAINAPMRLSQYAAAMDPARRLPVARALVRAKVHNCRTLLRRNKPDCEALPVLRSHLLKVRSAPSEAALLGLEGSAARTYFAALGELFAARGAEFDWQGRNRRPPKDPCNALLSYLYSVLLRDAVATLQTLGLDPYVGLYHRPGHGKPSGALDLMEPYRPVIADSAALGLLGRGELTIEDFVTTTRGVALTDTGRRTVIRAYERRMDALFEHPLFHYQVSYRRALEIDARLLGRYVQGELPILSPLAVR